MQKNILLVDGMALLFRGYYATAFRGNFMKTKKGIPTNGVFQFLRYFLDAMNTFKPTHVICCWDMGSKTFRTELYEAYKANREKPPKELIPQFDLVKEVVEAFNIPNIGLENYEADDCMGTLARAYRLKHNILILTGDLDMLQLVDKNIKVAIMRKGIGNYEIFDQNNFYDKKGIHPDQIVDFKALVGDAADNYPGVKGIGEKTARKLLQEYDTIENILLNLDNLSDSMRTRIKADLEILHISRTLATIKCDLPIQCQLEQAKWNYDETVVQEKFLDLEFKNLDKYLKNT